MAERDAIWLSKEQKERIKEILELSDTKDTTEVLTKIILKTRKPVEFNPCPDCGCEKYPLFDRRKTYNGVSLESSVVSAFCEICGWETQFHNNVRECAKEWNEVKI